MRRLEGCPDASHKKEIHPRVHDGGGASSHRLRSNASRRGRHRLGHAKEAVRELSSHQDQPLALRWLDELSVDLADATLPPEVRSLGRTLKRWRSEITAWHTCHFTNGPREARNNLIIRVKRVAFGFTSSGTTASGRCFTQASLTGHCSRPSPPTETRRAVKLLVVHRSISL